MRYFNYPFQCGIVHTVVRVSVCSSSKYFFFLVVHWVSIQKVIAVRFTVKQSQRTFLFLIFIHFGKLKFHNQSSVYIPFVKCDRKKCYRGELEIFHGILWCSIFEISKTFRDPNEALHACTALTTSLYVNYSIASTFIFCTTHWVSRYSDRFTSSNFRSQIRMNFYNDLKGECLMTTGLRQH